MSKKTITIKEIAKQSGVSVSTVSRVLNNNPSVAPHKRKRIQEVIDELGYQPSMFARGMISKQTHTFAVVVPDITNPYFTSLIFEIEQYSKELGYSLLLMNTMTAGKNKIQDSPFSESNDFKTIMEKQVDGVIILGGEIDKEEINDEYLQSLHRLNNQIPVVIIGQNHDGCECLFVERDLEKGVTLLTQHLLALGNTSIGFIGGEPGVKITEQRLHTFKKIMGIYSNIEDDYIILNDYYIKDGYQAMKQLIEQEKPLPQAVITINDVVATGAIRALADAGLQCPKDIKIASCDYFMNSEYQVPRITTIDQHNDYLGKIAVQQLLNIINSSDDTIESFHNPELVIRESCGTHLKEDI
ncbi:MAG: LacI family DNA-binding transcriptional regulator [Coprobacillaceae bacterium]